MKANLKNVLLTGQFFLLGALCAGSFTACSSDDDPEVLVSPTKSGDAVATLNSLTFAWNKVENATSYSYTLKDASGTEIKSGTTSTTTVYFSGLEPGTTYTLEVIAVGDGYTDSTPLTLTATTENYIQLATPTLTANVAARSVISWNAVANAATYTYSYTLDGVDVEETTTDTSLTLDFLPLDTDVKFSVVASNSSNEQYLDSEVGSVVAKRTRTAVASAQADANVWSEDSGAYQRSGTRYTITEYSDGSYTVSDWTGIAGYDLTFMAAEQGTGSIKVDAYIYPDWPDYAWLDIPGASEYDGIQVYTGGEYAGIWGEVSGDGGFWIYDNTNYTQYYITWLGVEATYDGTWTTPNGDVVSSKVIKYSDGSYEIEGWYGTEGYNFVFSVDENGAITPAEYYYFDSQYWCYWVPTSADKGVWIYVASPYGALDSTGVWFYEYGYNSYYWMKFEH